MQCAGLIHQLTAKARSVVRDIDPQNDLTFLRVKSKKHEIMVAPGKRGFAFLKKKKQKIKAGWIRFSIPLNQLLLILRVISNLLV